MNFFFFNSFDHLDPFYPSYAIVIDDYSNHDHAFNSVDHFDHGRWLCSWSWSCSSHCSDNHVNRVNVIVLGNYVDHANMFTQVLCVKLADNL